MPIRLQSTVLLACLLLPGNLVAQRPSIRIDANAGMGWIHAQQWHEKQGLALNLNVQWLASRRLALGVGGFYTQARSDRFHGIVPSATVDLVAEGKLEIIGGLGLGFWKPAYLCLAEGDCGGYQTRTSIIGRLGAASLTRLNGPLAVRVAAEWLPRISDIGDQPAGVRFGSHYGLNVGLSVEH